MVKLNNNDFEIAKSVIVLYPQGAGGKAVINMLALADNAVLQCAETTKHLISNKDSTFKLNVLLTRIQSYCLSGAMWNDLNMGDLQSISTDYIPPFDQAFCSNHHNFAFYDTLKWAIDNQKTFFLTAHDFQDLAALCTVWPNSKIVYLSNSYNFVFHQRTNYKNGGVLYKIWNDIKGPDWPDSPPTNLIEYNALDCKIRTELESDFQNMIFDRVVLFDQPNTIETIKKIAVDHDHYVFDCECYSNVCSLVDNIKILYAQLGLTNFVASDVKKYACAWYDAAQKK
jgi:hypothetical protein